MKHIQFIIIMIAASALMPVLGGCNQDLFVTDEGKLSGTYTIEAGDSVTIPFHIAELNNVTMEFKERTQMNFYDAGGNMFDRTNSDRFTINYQLAKLHHVTFTNGDFSVSVTVDRAGGVMVVSAASNKAAKEVWMKMVMSYEYSERTLIFNIGGLQ